LDIKAVTRQPVERTSCQPRAQPHRTEEGELRIRRQATQVLLTLLDSAVVKGVLTEKEYQAKRSKCNRELRRTGKSLKAAPQ
jgi:hypothetical protein